VHEHTGFSFVLWFGHEREAVYRLITLYSSYIVPLAGISLSTMVDAPLWQGEDLKNLRPHFRSPENKVEQR
jgi:hypothetical protein